MVRDKFGSAVLSKDSGERRSMPLAGVRVLTIDNYYAGNYGPMLLAQHGAEVVKVEQPGVGDPLRTDAPYLDPDAKRFAHGELRLMRGKDSVAIDVRTEGGLDLLYRLVREADVFWTNLRPSAAERLGINADVIQKINPNIVYASLSGFGLNGGKSSAFADEPAFDIIIQSLTGLMTRNANPDGSPAYSGLATGDSVTSLFAAFGVMMALFARERGAPAATVDVAMFDSMLALNEKTFSLFSMDGVVRPPRISATNSPFGAYRGSDGYLAIGVGGAILWERFCRAVGREDLYARTDLNTGVKRVQSEDTVIRPAVEQWLQDKTVETAARILLSFDVPASAILEIDSPKLREHAFMRGITADLDIPGQKKVAVVQSPVRLSIQSEASPTMPHSLGEDTERVLRSWLGLVDAEITSLRADLVIS